MAEVQYRLIAGYPGYRIGTDGSVWSCWRRGSYPVITDKWRQMKLKTSKKLGYVMAGLKRPDGYHWLLVHRLVLEAFVGPCPPGMECRHFPDGTRSNNVLSNLSWGTRKQNHQDKRTHGTLATGERVGSSRLTEDNVMEIRKQYSEGKLSQTELASRYGVTQANVSEIVNMQTWKQLTEVQ